LFFLLDSNGLTFFRMVKITIKKSDMTEEPGSEGSADDSGSDEEARTPILLIR
jgi:hypothetical protein